MDDVELMTIGRFARISGVSIHALRHYDEVGLLTPAAVDSSSGYRRYQPNQIDTARMICALRGIDLPIEGIRQVLASGSDDEIRQVLIDQRQLLELQHSHLAARIDDVNHYLEKGITVPTIQPGCRPVQIWFAVDDEQASVAFYKEAFGLNYEVSRRTKDRISSSFRFGTYGNDDFFLLWVSDDRGRVDRPGPMTFGLLVDDLDAIHAQAVAVGGTELVSPHEPEGMPRCSAVKDLSGNWIWLYEGGIGCKPAQIKLGVDDTRAAIAFYQAAFGLDYGVIRHTEDQDYSSFRFGTAGQDDFFLLTLKDDPSDMDNPSGSSNFALLVDDLDAVHARAVAAGATEVIAPRDATGMPRSSRLKDPSGNWVGLFQG
ncbi:VOC family protein [Phytoactinopolyspora endophytica]|uniref:VOC family protein n=1 Tax=Phytoactinopolyspora endophytica TaxID=1642495 RepID=UPI00101BA727|nr:VOC family protein [Phytoactinopolyspora endophytica]